MLCNVYKFNKIRCVVQYFELDHFFASTIIGANRLNLNWGRDFREDGKFDFQGWISYTLSS